MIVQALKSKTIWLAIASTAIGFVELNFSTVSQYVPQAYHGWLFVGIGVAGALIRAVTTKPLSAK